MAVSKWNIELINEMHETGDTLADDAVREMYGDNEVQKVNNMLQEIIDNDDALPSELPQDVKDYLERSDDLPKWIDWNLIRVGQEAFEDYALLTLIILGCASLPEDYLLEDSARVLGRTQRLDHHVRRRIWETGIFLFNTMSLGGLGPDGKGLRSAQKVRLMHAAVRHLLQTDAPPEHLRGKGLADEMLKFKWEKEYGMPINQVAMAAAYLSFSYIVIRCLQKAGAPLTDEQIKGWLHCWNVLGHVMGVKEEMLLDRPERMEQAEELYNLIWKRYTVKSSAAADINDGRELTQALIGWMEEEIDDRGLDKMRDVPRTLVRFFMGKKKAKQLGVELDWNDRIILRLIEGWAWVRRKTNGGLYNRVPWLDDGLDKMSMHVFEMIFKQDRRKHGGVFEMPQPLIKKMGVEHIVRKHRPIDPSREEVPSDG